MLGPEQRPHTVEQMYGLYQTTSACLTKAFTRDEPFSTFYGYDLLDLLADRLRQSPNTVIGIERCDPRKVKRLTQRVNGQRFYLSSFRDKADKKFWQMLVDQCQRLGSPAIYLDDFGIHRQAAEKLIEYERYHDELSNLNRDTQLSPTLESQIEKRQLLEVSHKAWIEEQYLSSIQKGEAIAQKIAQSRPAIVILSKQFRDYFLAHPQILEAQGVRVADFPDSERRQDQLNRARLGRELLLRQHRLFSGEEMIPQNKPDYVGTWDTYNQIRGWFQLYLTGNAHIETPIETKGYDMFVGVIEDTMGTAKVRGQFTDDGEVEFTKTYQPEKTLAELGAILSPIDYQANRCEDGWYRGFFSYDHDNLYAKERKSEPFIMGKYSQFHQPDQIPPPES